MSRTRIAALALVNWKGVFYERYLLDRHVTALEGANGAGKTTVMIAAYVALLPDMTKLRFTNLGETAATGGDRGIWGRLGELGRPSYTVLELDAEGGERVLVGVRLVRLAEPTVEPTGFLITGLPADVRLSDILLERRLDGDHVPELDEIKVAVARAGGAVEVFRTTKDYFAAMFERGITPMNLVGEEARGKFNEMLRTSMTGGISRALTSELRGFLLKEETGLADTLARMRANLEACSRTRSEVSESRQLEREISAIYEAGSEMFGAAIHATREAALEAERGVAQAQPLVDAAARVRDELVDHTARLGAREADLGDRLVRARADLAVAVAERERVAAARTIAARLAEIDRELAVLEGADRDARAHQAVATAERAAAKQERGRALEAYDRAALGLAHLQTGLDELVRRAHGHRQLERRLADARGLLAREALEPDHAAAAIAELDTARAELELERARLQRDGRDLAARRAEHASARAALVAIDPAADALSAGELHPHARTTLARLADRETLIARAHELERDHLDAERLATRQRAAQTLAGELGIATTEPGAAAMVLAELEAIERALQTAGDEAELRRAESTATHARIEEHRGRLATLDDRSARWHLAGSAASRLAAAGPTPATRADVAALRDRIVEEQLTLTQRRGQLEARRDELQRTAATLDRGDTTIDPELLRLRDELGAELLAGRFEDLDVAAASWVEARLGPLANALIVDDVDAAARALEDATRTVPTVWLIAAGSELGVAPPEAIAELDEVQDVVCPEPFGLRVTRRVPRPNLGRRARERRAHELHEAIARDGRSLDELAERAALVATWRREVDVLEAHFDALVADDPAHERARLDSEIATLEHAEHARREATRVGHAAAQRGRTRLEGLRRLLGEAPLLDPPDHTARARELLAVRTELGRVAAELVRVASARTALADHVDVLRHPPPDDATLETRTTRLAALDARLDRLASARAALEDVLVHRHAAAWSDAEAALDAQAGLAPALESQHADARAAVHAADAAEAAAEAAWETATAAAQLADGHRLAALAHRDRGAAELAGLGAALDERSERELTTETAAARVAQLDGELRELVTQRALAAERLAHATRAAEEARTRLTAETRGAGPALAAWNELRGLAETDGLLHAVLGARAHKGRTSIQLIADAWSKRELLLDRVARARGGDELVVAIREQPLDGPGYLRAWQAGREWLRRRVPAQVVEVDEPLLALERLRDHLDVLEGRLARQEGDLRGASEDVARGIDVQVRRAHGQVRRLNTQLDGIRFGSIHGIRVEIRRIDRMEQILRALRLGEAQELLFMSSIPIEEALDEIFRRYGGGGRSGGQRILDYREYLELAVEIRRQTSGAWESASPTRLSTGEAIGVGAALMMVVLTEWERDANILRARRAGGSLRFLFLDEANRLSRDNLGVLFDLCKHLDLQLLIAAPEVARAEGNTTYRLVRHVTDDGHEEVIVSGRRAAPQLEPPEVSELPDIAEEPPASVDPAADVPALDS